MTFIGVDGEWAGAKKLVFNFSAYFIDTWTHGAILFSLIIKVTVKFFQDLWMKTIGRSKVCGGGGGGGCNSPFENQKHEFYKGGGMGVATPPLKTQNM